MIKKKLVVGELAKDLGQCRGCAEGKLARAPFKATENSVKTKQLLELVHIDLCGPMQTPTPGGKRYVLTFLDDWSRMVKLIYFLTTKDQVYEHFNIFKAATEKATGKTLKALRSDGGGEYVGHQLQDFLQQHGIEHQKTAPYSPQQNGTAEGLN